MVIELKKRAGDDAAVQAQEGMNVKLRVAKLRIEQRRSVFVPGGRESPSVGVSFPGGAGVSDRGDGPVRR